MELDSHSDWNITIAKETAILEERGAWGTPLKESTSVTCLLSSCPGPLLKSLVKKFLYFNLEFSAQRLGSYKSNVMVPPHGNTTECYCQQMR